MQLESIQVVVRPRGHWESVDLGLLMARRWWLVLTGSWLATAGPVFLVSAVLTGSPFWSVLITWWLKPLYERLPLHVLSAAIFGEQMSISDAVRRYRESVVPGLMAALTISRLSANRGFYAPVAVLEGLARRDLRTRYRILHRSAGAAAGWLTILGIHIEGFLYVGVLALVFFLVPGEFKVDWWSVMVDESNFAIVWGSTVLWFACMMFVAPVYVACGFSLYLNRRMELEGWDIEVGFRRVLTRVPDRERFAV
ncbi:MAG: hypothetical protein O7H39_13820 [Gammaproteobacteria bacterium]|nr:hypothetical protein [Gammaproteobacteria bacterium]